MAGLATALAGLYVLVFAQGASDYGSLWAQALMTVASVAWGVYSIRGRGTTHAKAVTRGNFIRAAAPSATLLPLAASHWQWDPRGFALAVVSGALTSATRAASQRVAERLQQLAAKQERVDGDSTGTGQPECPVRRAKVNPAQELPRHRAKQQAGAQQRPPLSARLRQAQDFAAVRIDQLAVRQS